MARGFRFAALGAVLAGVAAFLLISPPLRADSTPPAPSYARTSATVNTDDRENTTPTAWWIYSGQSVADVTNFVNANNARVVDLNIDAYTPTLRLTVTYVQNTGTYAKAWWWYVGVDEATLNAQVTANTGRLTVVKAYDIGGGAIRFVAVMVSNTGADYKAWWWYYNQTTASVTANWQANSARLTQVQSYVAAGQTRYAVVMISNSGADASAWWWYVNATVSSIVSSYQTNNARLIDLDRDPSTGNYNVIMESCASGCPLWWWYVGATGQQLLDTVAQDGSRIIDANSYAGCGGTCYAYLMINNSNAVTSRVGELLRNGTDGTKGLYLKEVSGPVLANLEDGFVFEPASTIKVALHLYAMRQVQAGARALGDQVAHYTNAADSCPDPAIVSGTESLSTALGEMMRHSDNARTREISTTFGINNINYMMTQTVGMPNSRINHVIGCGGPIPDTTTLDDLGTLYEKVANGTLLTAPNRNTFYSFMAGKAQFQLEGYDWTHLWDTDIPNIINQEAPVGMSAANRQAFRDKMNLAYKAGNYKICTSGGCATYFDHISIAGWAQIPFCGNNPNSRQYVFGVFIYNSTSDTTSSATFTATKAELLREQIRAGLASCAGGWTYLPLIRR